VIRPIRVLVIMLGRFGVAARGAVFMVGGMLLVLAAVHVSPQEARGLGGTLRRDFRIGSRALQAHPDSAGCKVNGSLRAQIIESTADRFSARIPVSAGDSPSRLN
jgi:hypothetical protein